MGSDDPGSSFTVSERIRGTAVTGAVPVLRWTPSSPARNSLMASGDNGATTFSAYCSAASGGIGTGGAEAVPALCGAGVTG